jgi:hypothetical protein
VSYTEEAVVRNKEILELLQDLIALSIPIAILVISIVLPLRPFVRQALIGVMMVWFGVEAMTGFHFGK